MPKHHEIRHLPYSPREIYDMVADIEAYPEFLPWCSAARILQRSDHMVIADLVIRFKAFHDKYTSKVTLTSPEPGQEGRIDVMMVQGPFNHLTNLWVFREHPEGGTELEFSIDFSFKSVLLEKMIGSFFTLAFTKMSKAFEERAHALFGK